MPVEGRFWQCLREEIGVIIRSRNELDLDLTGVDELTHLEVPAQDVSRAESSYTLETL